MSISYDSQRSLKTYLCLYTENTHNGSIALLVINKGNMRSEVGLAMSVTDNVQEHGCRIFIITNIGSYAIHKYHPNYLALSVVSHID